MSTFGRKAVFTFEIMLLEAGLQDWSAGTKGGWKYRLGSHCAINDGLYLRTASEFPRDHEEWEEKLAQDEAMGESRMDATFREKGREYFSLTNERKKRSVRE